MDCLLGMHLFNRLQPRFATRIAKLTPSSRLSSLLKLNYYFISSLTRFNHLRTKQAIDDMVPLILSSIRQVNSKSREGLHPEDYNGHR